MAGLKRGDVHLTRFGRARGRTQAGTRPAVVLQTNGMASWSTVIVAPLSTSARPTSFRTPVDVGAQKSLVLADQVQALDVAQLGKRLGALTPNQMSEVETALKSVLELR